jgi:hypothetical protein
MILTRPGVAPSGPAEEWIDERLHRPLAALFIRPLLATSITPNQVTVGAGLVGVFAGLLVFAAVERPALRLAAAGLLVAAVVLDCMDGQLARARGTSSKTGDMLDGLADLAVNLTVLGGITYSLIVISRPAMGMLGLAAMLSYGLQCSLFDFTKRLYLSRVGARPLPTAAELAQIERDRELARGDGRVVEAFLLWFYCRYLGTQRAVAAAIPGLAPSALTEARMRLWTWLGLGTHLAVLYTTLAVAAVWTPALLVAFLLFVTVGNGLMLTLVFKI